MSNVLAGYRVVVPLRRVAMAPTTRYINTSRVAKTEPSDPDAFEDGVPETKILRAEPITALPPSAENPEDNTHTDKVIGYKGWLRQNNAMYKEMKPGGSNYVGGNPTTPFPLNPWFRVRAPLSDSIRESIYQDYLKDPERVTPRILGERYRISIKRVEAILKLKAIEHHMVENEGFTAQKKLTAGMESMMGTRSQTDKRAEALYEEVPNVSNPRFYAVPEGTDFTPADAADVLGRKPFQHIVDHLTASKPFAINYNGLDPKFAPRVSKKISLSAAKRLEELGPVKEEVLEKDLQVTSERWKFVFVDTAKRLDMKDRTVLIREQDGTLKKAGRDFKLKTYGRLWRL
ncbi:hypothetical protein EV175_005264 [Coemansia sp. RSA 1933]|nr:hypothetical protein EV175_005264 [Coemansia sp. RSA 1933]